MQFKSYLLFALTLLGAAGGLALAAPQNDAATDAPQYDSAGKIIFPADYREWIYLSSGMDMSYSDTAAPDAHIFTNVFVPRAAYVAFLKNGVWPDKTVLMLEARSGAGDVSIAKRGVVQTQQVTGVIAHVKGAARFKGGWAFFAFDSDKPAEMVPTSAPCYSCHQQHAAADTTFVQFYPTLLPVATKLGTLNPSYVAETPKSK
jgi:Cytochrome P460